MRFLFFIAVTFYKQIDGLSSTLLPAKTSSVLIETRGWESLSPDVEGSVALPNLPKCLGSKQLLNNSSGSCKCQPSGRMLQPGQVIARNIWPRNVIRRDCRRGLAYSAESRSPTLKRSLGYSYPLDKVYPQSLGVPRKQICSRGGMEQSPLLRPCGSMQGVTVGPNRFPSRTPYPQVGENTLCPPRKTVRNSQNVFPNAVLRPGTCQGACSDIGPCRRKVEINMPTTISPLKRLTSSVRKACDALRLCNSQSKPWGNGANSCGLYNS